MDRARKLVPEAQRSEQAACGQFLTNPIFRHAEGVKVNLDSLTEWLNTRMNVENGFMIAWSERALWTNAEIPISPPLNSNREIEERSSTLCWTAEQHARHPPSAKHTCLGL